MIYQISNNNELLIDVTYDDGTWQIPKFRLFIVVDEPYAYLYWTDTEKGSGGFTRRLVMDYNDVLFGVYAPSSAAEVKTLLDAMITKAWSDISSTFQYYVPYTGATNNVDLGVFGLTADYVEFDLNPISGAGPGKIVYDGQTGSLTYNLNNSNVPSHIGQTLHAYVHNAEAVTINKGQAVYLYQATGNKASVKLAYNTSDATSAKTFGLAAEDITAGGQGMVITVGQLQGVNTAAFTEGDTLYLGATAGTYTNVKPYAPNHLVYVGIVEKSNANGEIYVRVQNGYELDEIHDVDLITTPPTNGDVLTYNGSLWVAQAPTGGSGITSLNSQTGTTQTFATGSSGTDFNIASATNTHTFNIPTASATNRGLLSTTDWSTFNSKFTLPALTSGSVLFSNGTTIAQDNANLFWDNTNKRLGIGTNAPSNRFQVTGSITASSALGLAINFNPTLVASANNDILSCLDLNPTFTNGAFTGVSNYNLRLSNIIGINTLNSFGINYELKYALIASSGIGSVYSPNGTPTGYAYLFQFNKSSSSNSNNLLIIGGGSSAAGNSANKHIISTSCDGSTTSQPLVLRTASSSTNWSSVNDHITIFSTGNVVIQNTSASATDAGFRLDIVGTSRLGGNTTINGTISATLNQNAISRITITNTTSGTSSQAEFVATSSNGSGSLGKLSSGYTTYKSLNGNDCYLYNATSGNISILNDFATGTIKFTAGGSNTVHWTINSNGNLEANNAINMVFGTTTGTKIGTATTQKIGFWNATPIVQPTTAVAGATRVGGAGTNLTDTDTFDGYTIAQIVKALRNTGILA